MHPMPSQTHYQYGVILSTFYLRHPGLRSILCCWQLLKGPNCPPVSILTSLGFVHWSLDQTPDHFAKRCASMHPRHRTCQSLLIRDTIPQHLRPESGAVRMYPVQVLVLTGALICNSCRTSRWRQPNTYVPFPAGRTSSVDISWRSVRRVLKLPTMEAVAPVAQVALAATR